MNYYVIPEIAGRLLVGPPPDYETKQRPEITFWIDVDPPDEDMEGNPVPGGRATPRQMHYLTTCYWARLEPNEIDGWVSALKWFWEKSQMVGSVFYLFSPPRAWEMAAMCLMARWGWTKKKCAEIIGELLSAGLDSSWTPEDADIDLAVAEKAYQAWLERGTSQR